MRPTWRKPPSWESPDQRRLPPGERDLSAVALEIVVPLLSNLEFGAAARYDHYSDFGSTDEP